MGQKLRRQFDCGSIFAIVLIPKKKKDLSLVIHDGGRVGDGGDEWGESLKFWRVIMRARAESICALGSQYARTGRSSRVAARHVVTVFRSL